MFVCMYVCLYVCLFVCLFVCLLDMPAWSTLIRYTCCTWEEAEFIGRGPYRKMNSAPPTRLPLRAKTYATLIPSYNFFLKMFSHLTSLLIKSLWRYMLLYICNKYKRLIKFLTTSILLYICNNKYKRLIKSLTRYILLYICT